ncbi:MAG TPA: autotransporter-associated beta strand repeat-containing protein, partial [Candidatus Saccharimonadales bacterium]
MKNEKLKLFFSAFLLSVSSLLAFVAPKALAATVTWDGGGSDSNMTTAENWSGDVAPSADDDLVFPADVTNRTVANDFTAGTSFNSITFSGAATVASNYTFTGNSMTLVDGISITMTGSASKYQTLGMPLVLNGTQTFADGSGGLILSGTLDLGSSALTINSGSGVLISGVISGTGTIIKTGTGDLRMTGTNTYSGATTV